MTSFRDFETDKAWNYVRSKTPSAKTVARYLHFNEQHDGSLELVVKPGWPGKVMENLPDGSYTTKDLFVRHPTIPDAYKVSQSVYALAPCVCRLTCAVF